MQAQYPEAKRKASEILDTYFINNRMRLLDVLLKLSKILASPTTNPRNGRSSAQCRPEQHGGDPLGIFGQKYFCGTYNR
jgi:hypothetical protein